MAPGLLLYTLGATPSEWPSTCMSFIWTEKKKESIIYKKSEQNLKYKIKNGWKQVKKKRKQEEKRGAIKSSPDKMHDYAKKVVPT